MIKAVGLPRMHKEPGERRDFLPALVNFLDRVGAASIVLEEGYGEGLGLTAQDYRAASAKVRFAPYEECLGQELVFVLRCPAEEVLAKLQPGQALLSMLHLATRPTRRALLDKRQVLGFSLDSLSDDHGRRLVEDLDAVASTGVRGAFRELSRLHPRFSSPNRPALRVTVLGPGAVGTRAIRCCAQYGDPSLQKTMAGRGVMGVEVTAVDFDLAGHPRYLLERLALTDLLIDATQRPDPTQVVVPNAWLGALPAHAVVLDLAVDPYDFSLDPPAQKAIEGLPEGNLDQFVFGPDDPAFERIPSPVDRRQRRVTLSCYSWPGVDPYASMDVYGKQVEPVLRVLLEKEPAQLDDRHGSFFERALARALSSHFGRRPQC